MYTSFIWNSHSGKLVNVTLPNFSPVIKGKAQTNVYGLNLLMKTDSVKWVIVIDVIHKI